MPLIARPGWVSRTRLGSLRIDAITGVATSPMIWTSPRFSASSAACASGYSLNTKWSTLGLPLPVVRVGIQHDLVALTPLAEDEGPGADRMVAEILAGFRRRRGADHAVPNHRQAGEQGGRRLLHLELHRAVVDGAIGRDGAIGEVGQVLHRTGVADVVRVVFLQLSIHVAISAWALNGVPSWIVDALAQVEGVGQPSAETSQLCARPGSTSTVPGL